jgi:hypothetical protein
MPFTDADTNSIINSRTFHNRRFFELDLAIGTSGGTIVFDFPSAPGSTPSVSINGGPAVNLKRSGNLNLQDTHDFYFRNTERLNDVNLTSNNADVASGQYNAGNAYVIMYIVAVGNNPEDFNLIVSSKPTFINLFKLPN